MAVMAADSVPQRMAATTTGMRKVNETGGSSSTYRINIKKATVETVKTSAMMTPVTPPGAIALRVQMGAESRYFLTRDSVSRPPSARGWARSSPKGNADLSMLMSNMRTHCEQ